nr:hypothetical protein [Tanacetum cinerariifolium]
MTAGNQSQYIVDVKAINYLLQAIPNDIYNSVDACYDGNGNKNAGRQNRNQAFNAGTRNDKSNQIVQRLPRTNLLQEREMFSVITATRKATMLVIVKNQEFVTQTNGNAEIMPSYDAKAVSEVNASSKVYEQVNHVKCKTIIQTFDDDQIDSNIIFDDPYVENNGGTSEHDSNARSKYHEIQMLPYNVQRESENQKRLNNVILEICYPNTIICNTKHNT